MKQGTFRFIPLLFVVVFVFLGILVGGSPIIFLDGVSAFFVVVPLPFLLALSGLQFTKQGSFWGGIISTVFVSNQDRDQFSRFAEAAGFYSVLLGIINFMISVIFISHYAGSGTIQLGDKAVSVALLSILYGVLLKTIIFDPYSRVLRTNED